MKYCCECLMPDTKPYISFDKDGVCNACHAHRLKKQHLEGIDWRDRESEFDQLVVEAKAKRAPFYDALVPVSGGKDSLTQIHRLLKHDVRILAVNVDYGIKTEIGWNNLNLIPRMGANLIVYRPEQALHRRLIRIGFEEYGDPDLLSHTLLHAYPLHVALRFQIPMALLGENSAFEYGGDKEIAQESTISRQWFDRYAANAGRDARFISKNYQIPMSFLRLYDFPDELEQSDCKAVFCSYYYPWDSEAHLKIAQRYGFQALEHPGEGTYRNYVGIDEKINRVHQYLKVLKFGYGRATDHACEDIRNGRLTRLAAKELVRSHDLLPLSNEYIDDCAEYFGMSRETFLGVLERYRNPQIWQRTHEGEWYIPEYLED